MKLGRLQINFQIYPKNSTIPERWSWSIRWWKPVQPVKTDLRNPPQKDSVPSKNERRVRSIGEWP